MKKFLIPLFFLCVNVSLFAQSEKADLETACHDTLLFRQLQIDKSIAPTTDLKLFSRYYQILQHGYNRNSDVYKPNRRIGLAPFDNKTIDSDRAVSTLNPVVVSSSETPTMYDYEYDFYKYFMGEDSLVTPQQREAYSRDPVNTWNMELVDQFYRQHGLPLDDGKRAKTYHRRAEMKDLVNRLTLFRDKAGNLPIFFTDIDGKFGGNISKYVKNLYNKSIMGNLNLLRKFTTNPSLEMIQSDPGVQFAVGLALYELWIKEIREKTGKSN